MPSARSLVRAALAAVLLAAGAACADSAPTDVGPVPSAGSGDADLDSLFGGQAPAIRRAVAAQREALALAAEQALAGADVAPGARLAAAAVAPSTRLAGASGTVAASGAIAANDPALPPPFSFERTDVQRGGEPDAPWESTTTTTLDATITDGVLSVVGSERTVVRGLNPPGQSVPRASTVTEVLKRLDVAICPDPSGRSAGSWTSSEREWSVRASADVAGPANHDAIVELTAEGTTTAHVDDLAEIATYDLDVLYGARKARLPGNRPIDKRATFHVVRAGVAPGDLRRLLTGNMITDRTGDHDLLTTLGYGPTRFHTELTQRVQTAYGRARRAWRNGVCVEVVPVRGATGGALAPGATASLGPDARSKVDGATITVGTHAAQASSGTLAPPTSGVAHPAAFAFTMPASGGARVSFTHTSRRGIGFGSVAFTPATPGFGTIAYQASSSYSVNGVDEWQQAVSGAISGQSTVASAFTLAFDHAESDGSRWYDVLAENRITFGGGGEVRGTVDGWRVTFRLAIDGDGVSHNPWRAGDQPIVESRILTPYQRRPQHTAGSLRLYVRNGRPHYELRLNVNPIAPGFTTVRRVEMECPGGGWGTATTAYDNGSRATTVTLQDPERCIRSPGQSYTDASPYLFGAISTNWFEPDAATGSNAMVTGTYDAGTTVLTGERTYTTTSCERVVYLDPTQLGQHAISYAGLPNGLSFERLGQCSLTYTIRWSVPLPAGA